MERVQTEGRVRALLIAVVLGGLMLFVACSDSRPGEGPTEPHLQWENIWVGTGIPDSLDGVSGVDYPAWCDELFDHPETSLETCDFMSTTMRDSLLSVFDDSTFRSDDMHCVALKNAITDVMSSQHGRAVGETAGTGDPWGAAATVEGDPAGVFASDELIGAPIDTVRITMGHEAYHLEHPEDGPPDGYYNAEDAGRYCFGYSDFMPLPWQPS